MYMSVCGCFTQQCLEGQLSRLVVFLPCFSGMEFGWSALYSKCSSIPLVLLIHFATEILLDKLFRRVGKLVEIRERRVASRSVMPPWWAHVINAEVNRRRNCLKSPKKVVHYEMLVIDSSIWIQN